jgi:two-component system chemotaxis sensor kinase CheA
MLDEALKEFLIESQEGLDQLDREFVALEADPGAHERIGTIFRTIHTIKGTSGFLGFSKLEALTHAGESLLVLLRDKTLTLDKDMTSALLSMVDQVRAVLRNIEAEGKEGVVDHAAIIARLHALKTAGPSANVAAKGAQTARRCPLRRQFLLRHRSP